MTEESLAESNIAAVRQFFDAIANGPIDDAYAVLFSPSVIQEEFPNRLLPEGALRDLAALKQAAARGKALMSSQRFELIHIVASDSTVAVEGRWSGTVGMDAGPFKAGMSIRTRFAQFFDFIDGKVIKIRSYDCFDPW